MSEVLSAEEVGDYIQKLASVQNLWTGKKLSITVIANPSAGAFTQNAKAMQCKKIFEAAVDNAKYRTVCVSSANTKVFYTKYAGHAGELALAVLAETCGARTQNEESLIVAAGGDGTSLEIQTALFIAAAASKQRRQAVMKHITVLRLPLGTGNDGTDGHTLEETMKLLEGPVHFANARALKITYEGHAGMADYEKSKKAKDLWNLSDQPWYAFNIASIGIDAYITYMTNRMKNSFPGDSYQLWVNVAAGLYDVSFPPADAEIEILGKNDELIDTVKTKIEYVLLGVSGHRTYGSNHHILPDDDNVCITPKMTLISKLVNMQAFSDGTHKAKKLSTFYTAEKLRIHYNGSVLVQMDGEPRLLTPAHFPLVMERTEPCIRVIESDALPYDKGAVKAD